ncbi:hypothetical protein ACMA5I_13775 [Paracoccaceae bacterium GXU_MW_L88]
MKQFMVLPILGLAACAASPNAPDEVEMSTRLLSTNKMVLTGTVGPSVDPVDLISTLGFSCEATMGGTVRLLSVQEELQNGRRAVMMICEDLNDLDQIGQLASELDRELQAHSQGGQAG